MFVFSRFSRLMVIYFCASVVVGLNQQTRRSTFNRQKQYFEQRKRKQQTTGLEDSADERSKRQNDHEDSFQKNDNEESRSLDIIGLTNLTTNSRKDCASSCSDTLHADVDPAASHVSKCLPSLPSNTTIPRHFIQMEKMENPQNFPLETQLPQRLPPATNPNTRRPTQNCSEDIYNAVKECKVRLSSDNSSFIKYGNKKRKDKASDNLSLLDILNDDEPNKNMDARLAPEAHVAFSVEGLGKIAAETPTRTPTHRGRAPVAAFCSPLKPAKRMKSYFKVQPASVDLEIELDTVMQDLEVPLGRLPPAVSYWSEDTFLDKPNFLEHDQFNMMHGNPTRKDPSLEDDAPSFWQVKHSRTCDFAFEDIGASHRFGSGENYKAGRSLRKQTNYGTDDFDGRRHPTKDDAFNVDLSSLADGERRFCIASSSDETSLSPPVRHRRTCESSKNVKVSASKANHHEKLRRRLDKEYDLRSHPVEKLFQDLNEGLRDINYGDETSLSPPVRHKRSCESLKNVKVSTSKSNHQDKLHRRMEKEYDFRNHPVERVFQDFNEDLCENDVDRGGFRAFSSNRKSKTYDCFGKPSACKAPDLFSLDEDIGGSVLKSPRTSASGMNFDYKLSKDIDLVEPGGCFPQPSGGFSGNRPAGSQSSRSRGPYCRRGSVKKPDLTHKSKNIGRHPFGLFDEASLLHSPEGYPRDDHYSREVANKNILNDEHDESDFLSTSCTKTSEKETSNKSGLEDKGSSTRMDIPSHILDHGLEASDRVLSQDRETRSFPIEEALSATQEVSPKAECFVRKKLDQIDTSPLSPQNRNEVNCSQETIKAAQTGIGENPADPSYQVMLQSYVLQLLCVQKVLMDSSKESTEKKT